jgi:hypothetical protein
MIYYMKNHCRLSTSSSNVIVAFDLFAGISSITELRAVKKKVCLYSVEASWKPKVGLDC